MDDEFIPYLLDRGIQYHMRKGLRPDCTCVYCSLKRQATNAFCRHHNACYPSHEDDYWTRDYRRYYANLFYGGIRSEYRKELKELKANEG